MQAPNREDFALDSEYYWALAQYFETRYGFRAQSVDFYVSMAANAESWELRDSNIWSN